MFKLEKNYRSTAHIIEAASSVVKNNKNRAPKELIAHNGAGEKLGLIETNDEMEEADAVVNALEKELSFRSEILVILLSYIAPIHNPVLWKMPSGDRAFPIILSADFDFMKEKK